LASFKKGIIRRIPSGNLMENTNFFRSPFVGLGVCD
jgi:hypothetical protein